MIEPGNIYLGDCLKLMREMPDKSVDAVITDPPYGIGMGGRGTIGTSKNACVTDYGIQAWDSERLPDEYMIEIKRVSKNQVVFGGNYYGSILGDTSCYIVWDKDNTGDFADCELAWTSFKTAVRKIKWRWNGMLQEDMKHKEKRFHPTQKPVPVMSWIIWNYTAPDALILDPFLGSGTTAVACIKTGRRFIGIEIDPGYYEIARKRIEAEQSQLRLAL
jgi:site-specific DNA-methyltransferase (adenine-specific)